MVDGVERNVDLNTFIIKNIKIDNFKGVVDCFFSRLDCVYGVQSNMC